MHPLKFVQKMMLALILAGAVVTPGFAEADEPAAGSPAASPSLPPVQSQGQTEFMTGGIGLDESEAIKKEGSSWPLMLEFAQADTPRPEYISDAKVTIKDKSGNVMLEANAEGPYMLIRLAPGRYSLYATHESVTLHRELKLVKGQNRKITLLWPPSGNKTTQ
ncbi:hypothetical protein C8R31_102191 [Nitrosospira sp. Nsp2]|uniref:carboxypeptidase-like regulatory domain-containing protein n=1 Tax=Nitrosospira sp. Nsp2 TaxID=136548 RepID=UPI000D409C1A|nr:carboxypeptidase-like regulatory domain-containing protein [Nitrosospira sp. Nsp2]PTR16177.1 hypothetical protein C8R31_102191 [Nitrosospira sp. Nsp2]